MLGIGLSLSFAAMRRGGGGAPAPAYTPSDFSSDDGLTVTSVTQSGDDWIVSMTDGTDTASATFTVAELESGDPLVVREAVITESPTDTYTADPFWIIYPAGASVEATETWEAYGTPVASGSTYTATGVETVGGIDYVLSLSTGHTFTVVVQPEPAATVNPIKAAGGNGYITYNSTLADYPDQCFVLAGSYTVPSDLASFVFPFSFNKTVGTSSEGLYGMIGSTGELLFRVFQDDGVRIANEPRSSADAKGKTFCFVFLLKTDGSIAFSYRDSGGSTKNSTHAITAGRLLGAQGDFRTSTGVISQNFVGFWDRATDPARTALELLGDFYNLDTCLPRAAAIPEYSLGTPVLSVRGDAAAVNTGNWDGSFTGTYTPTNGGFVDA